LLNIINQIKIGNKSIKKLKIVTNSIEIMKSYYNSK